MNASRWASIAPPAATVSTALTSSPLLTTVLIRSLLLVHQPLVAARPGGKTIIWPGPGRRLAPAHRHGSGPSLQGHQALLSIGGHAPTDDHDELRSRRSRSWSVLPRLPRALAGSQRWYRP